MSIEDLIKQTIAESFAEILPRLDQTRTPEVMTKKQVAAYLQVSEGTVFNLIRREVDPLPACAVGDVRFLRSDVERWIRDEGVRKLANQRKDGRPPKAKESAK